MSVILTYVCSRIQVDQSFEEFSDCPDTKGLCIPRIKITRSCFLVWRLLFSKPVLVEVHFPCTLGAYQFRLQMANTNVFRLELQITQSKISFNLTKYVAKKALFSVSYRFFFFQGFKASKTTSRHLNAPMKLLALSESCCFRDFLLSP